MRIQTSDLPFKIDLPGAQARHLPGFGEASGSLAAEHFSLGAGADLAPLLVGLEHDACQSAHWGYVISGSVVVTYTGDPVEERCAAGDMFHWPAGHSVRVESDAELVMFSPQIDHGPVLDHLHAAMTAG